MRKLSEDEIDEAFQNRHAENASRTEKKAITFDFQKADRIPKSQLRALRVLHENFVRSLGSSLAPYLRSYVSGNLVSVEQISYSAFLDGLPANACMVSLNLFPYGDNAVLEINPDLIFPVLELLLGGKEISATAVNRDLTELERYILGDFFRLITTELDRMWKGVDEVEFRIESLDAKRGSVRTIGLSEAVVAIGMELKIEDRTGMINLAIPSITMKGMIQKFDQQGLTVPAGVNDEEQLQILAMLRRAVVTIEPQLNSKLSVGDLMALDVGSVVLLDHATDQPLAGTVNGQIKFKGKIVHEGQQQAFLVEAVNAAD